MVILIEIALNLKLTIIYIFLWRPGIDIVSIKKNVCLFGCAKS